MQKTLLATKEYEWQNNYKNKSIGDTRHYKTTRKSIIEKLNIGDEIHLRVQGSGSVMMILTLVKKEGSIGSRKLVLKVKKKYELGKSTKYYYEKYKIIAGAETAWIKRKNGN